MYYTYVLQSEVDHQFYVGYSKDLKLRFERHNKGYIDLNPLRAGLVERPEEYRWNSLGYHVRTGNKDNFLSLEFGLLEFGILDTEERMKRYRRYVYRNIKGQVNYT